MIEIPSPTSAPPIKTDALTGLVSRVGLEDYLYQRESWPDRDQALSIMSVEISRFGYVNDSMGAELGNKIIAMVAKRIQKLFGHATIIARTHGDHFCLAFEGDIDITEQIELMQDFTQRPIALRGEVIVLSVRIGVAVMGTVVKAPTLMLHAAEVALHRAKRDKLRLSFFQPDLEIEAKSAHQLENDLRVSLVTKHVELHKAITNSEFAILYQPIVDVVSRTVHAVEALIRWHHPKRGLISPANFIPLAEQIQVLDVLGNWVMRRACMDAVTLPSNADGSMPGISVNVSPTQFIEPNILLKTIRQALQESGIEPARLKLEITESASFSMEKYSVLNTLRDLGCQIALDDFGTGYSSLTQLNVLPLDYVKLDRSFISQIGGTDSVEEQRSDRMTRAVLSLAKALELTPIVEGIETEVQCGRLRHHGARLMQGFLFARPLPLEDLSSFITRFNQNA